MIDRVVGGFSPPQRQSFYFMFFVKHIEIAEHVSLQEQTQFDSELKFAIYKGVQIFNQTRQPVPVKFINGRAAVQKVQLSFFLKDYNVNRKVDFVAKLSKVVNGSDELIGQLTIQTHKYIDAYLQLGVDKTEEQGIFGQYKVIYVIFTDKTRHDLEKIVKAYKQESQSKQRQVIQIDKNETVKQAAKEPTQTRLSTPNWKTISKQQPEQKRTAQQKQQAQNSHEKSGANQSGIKSEGSKILFSQQVKYDDEPKGSTNILQQQLQESKQERKHQPTEKPEQTEQHKHHSNVVYKASQENNEIQEQQDQPLQRVTLTYQNYDQPIQAYQQNNQPRMEGEKTLPQMQQEIETKLRDEQYHQQLIEKADELYQREENQDNGHQIQQHQFKESDGDRKNKWQQNIQEGEIFNNQPPQKFNEETGQWEVIGEITEENNNQNLLTTSKQKTNEDSVSQIVENINFSNPPKYYDRNKQYYQPPIEEIHQVRHRPALSTPRDLAQEPLSNIIQQQGLELKQSGASLRHFKEEPLEKGQNEQRFVKNQNMEKYVSQLKTKPNQIKNKSSNVRPAVSLKYAEQTPQRPESPLIQLQKVQVQKVEQKQSDFKLTLKILIVIIITGLILYFLLRSTQSSHTKIVGPKSHHNSKAKIKSSKVEKEVKSRSQSKINESAKKKKKK